MAVGTKPGYKVGRDESGLTKREREVLDLLVEGLDGPRIAERLEITKQRVDQILKSLIKKGRVQKQQDRFVVFRDPVIVQRKREVSDPDGSV